GRRGHGGGGVVNDGADIALAVGADGVHLPASGLSPAAARAVLGATGLVGVSTHSVPEVEAAAESGADFAVFGPVYDTPSKRPFGESQGVAALAAACRAARLPVIASGGVTAARWPELGGAGAAGVAVTRALLEAADPAAATKELLAACERGWP